MHLIDNKHMPTHNKVMGEDDAWSHILNLGSLQKPGNYEGRERRMHPLFEELFHIDEEFSRYIDRLGWSARPEQYSDQAKQAVQKYIDAIRKHRDTVTSDVLLDPINEFRGNIDPVFIPLIRSMLGAEIITPEVWRKFRDAWCSSDLPFDIEKVLRTSDEMVFVSRFNHAQLDPYDNIKLRALQDMWLLEKLVEERRSWKHEAAPHAIPAVPTFSYVSQ